jgi:hypothetical protein
MAEDVSYWPLNVEGLVPSQASPCEIFCGQDDSGTGCIPAIRFSPVSFQYRPNNAPKSFVLNIILTTSTRGRRLGTFTQGKNLSHTGKR